MFRRMLSLVALSLAIGGCGSTRPSLPPDALSCDLTLYAVHDIYENWRIYQLNRARILNLQDPSPSFNVLSLSAGGQFGAYGAGFLVGWRSVGDKAVPGIRRDIQVVTGVSTGAILSTHAFLGLDEEIEKKYRTLSNRKIYRERHFIEYLYANSLLDTAGKDQLIDESLTTQLLDQVAQQEGRFLYIGIVNLDSGAFQRIDMVKLAREVKPIERRDRCFKAVIGASSAIPIAFSPKFIDGQMWVDGGARRHLFLTEPPAEALKPAVIRRLYSLVHGDLSTGPVAVENGVLPIAERTAELFIDQGMKDSIRFQDALASRCAAGSTCGPDGRVFATYYAAGAAAAAACAPALHQCGNDTGTPSDDAFCTPFMNCLADAGRRDGRDYAMGSRKWLTASDLCLGSAPSCSPSPSIRRGFAQ